MNTKTTIICPICKSQTCRCLLRDRQFLAREVGKLMKGQADSPATDDGGDLRASESEGTMSAIRIFVDAGDKDLLQQVLCGKMSVVSAAQYVKKESQTPHPPQPPAKNGKPLSEDPVFTVVDGDSQILYVTSPASTCMKAMSSATRRSGEGSSGERLICRSTTSAAPT